MTSYTIAPIPTLYRGRQYRSRLEARWAAFFDEVGLPAEYEPFDLGKWSPDFLISRRRASILVEVKPISTFCAETAGKMISACMERGLTNDVSAVLLLGVQPVAVGDEAGPLRLGWGSLFLECDTPIGFLPPSWKEAALAWTPTADKPGLEADVMVGDEREWFPLTGWAPPGEFWLTSYREYAKEAWARATNAVQRQPEGRRE
jgi:hypothetical protein